MVKESRTSVAILVQLVLRKAVERDCQGVRRCKRPVRFESRHPEMEALSLKPYLTEVKKAKLRARKEVIGVIPFQGNGKMT